MLHRIQRCMSILWRPRREHRTEHISIILHLSRTKSMSGLRASGCVPPLEMPIIISCCMSIFVWVNRLDSRTTAISLACLMRVHWLRSSIYQLEQTMIQTHKRFKRTLVYYVTDTQSANFRGNPLCQATKRHLNNICRSENLQIVCPCYNR